ncbi:MAG TPA: hypothetical protein VJ952_03540 [Opitutales bacterium]|nr:hypothetical protein [Opitutales bacterium]
MNFTEVNQRFSDGLREIPSQLRWCERTRYEEENMSGVAPGGYLNPWGFFVIATTIGGNAVVVGENDERVFFSDHTWFGDDEISFEDLRESKKWIDLPYSRENVIKALYPLAENAIEFEAKIRSGELDRLLDEID